ncbi:MAG: PD40 domain-containing protein [Acidobacteria bacterium]|nr:PD40 domain-containing protein [Acidobacteriota bacterium]
MKHWSSRKGLMVGMILVFTLTCPAEGEPPVPDYLGQTPPGNLPRLFAPQVVSSAAVEFGPAFSPDGTEMYFTRLDPQFRGTILVMRRTTAGWTDPAPASFSGQFSDAGPAFTVDGRRLFFQSKRPARGTTAPRVDWQIWYVQRTENGWSEAVDLELSVVSAAGEWNPCLVQADTLYFNADYPVFGGAGIYRCRLEDGHYGTPEHLGPAVNRPGTVVVEPCLPPDERFIVFYSAAGADNMSPGERTGDLYVSFRRENGDWTPGRNLGGTVNSPAEENWPKLSPDGQYLFFCSNRAVADHHPAIYWISADVIPSPEDSGKRE